MTDERLRLFVALELPDGVRSALAAWADRTAPPGVRRVPARNLHVTMVFLGACSLQTAVDAAELLASFARPLGPLVTSGALWLPSRRPGVLAVGLAAGSDLRGLHRDLVGALAEAVGFEPLEFHAEALELCRSHTEAGGARYESLARVGLTS